MNGCSVPGARLVIVLVLTAVARVPRTDAQETRATPSGQIRAAEAFAPFRWRNIGPNVGGRSITAAGSTKRPTEYYFGTVGGGLWKTTNAGTDWFPVTDGQIKSSSVGAVAVCEANPDVVYLGTGEAQLRNNITLGDGAYVSRDGGKTWTHIGLSSSTDQQAIARVRIDPNDCNRVYAAVLGDPYGTNAERGIFRSTDGGRTWQKVLYRDEKTGGIDLSIDPTEPRTLYATLWQTQRKPWEQNSGGPGSGIFKSVDGGTTWRELTRNPGLPTGRIGKIGISASGGQRNRVYALIEHEDGGLFRSDDGGATWSRVNASRSLYARAEYYTRVSADPVEANTVYINGDLGFYRSVDGGRNFRDIPTPHGDNHDLWIDPTNNRRMIQANDGGANVSWDAGATWTEQDYSTAQMYHVITTNDFPYYVCGAQQDNTSKCVPSDGDGSYHFTTAAGEQGYIAVHPENTDLTVGSATWGRVHVLDRKTGQHRLVDPWPDFILGHPPNKVRERFNWTFPVIMSPHDPEEIYVASQYVYRTKDRGQTWERISGDLTYADPATLEGEKGIIRNTASQDYYANIFTLALSPREPGLIWTGSDDGLIHISRDAGKTWQNVTPRDLPKNSRVSLIEVSPHANGKAYAAVERFKMQDVAPYIYRTTDYGKTWTKIISGIPRGDFVRAVKEDTRRPGLLFAGTEHRPYVSFDDGASWQSIQLGLPDVQVSDLEIKGNDLVLATYGRGFYVMDGALPALRQINAQVLAKPAHLFQPGDVVRSFASTIEQYRRTRRLNEVPIEYRLGVGAQRVNIEILDAQGNSVRTFSGAAGDRPPERILNSVGEWINGPPAGFPAPPPPVRTTVGVHRFVWDMRYPPATGFEGMFLTQTTLAGPYVPPGQYRVRLNVDGATQEQNFSILMDPRLKNVTLADLQEQSKLALQVHRRLQEATTAVANIRAIRKELDAGIRSAGGAANTSSDAQISARLAAIEDELFQRERSHPASSISGGAQYGVDILDRIAHLVSYDLFSADAKPTRAVYQVFEVISTDLQAQLDKLDAVIKSDPARFNAIINRARSTPVTDGR